MKNLGLSPGGTTSTVGNVVVLAQSKVSPISSLGHPLVAPASRPASVSPNQKPTSSPSNAVHRTTGEDIAMDVDTGSTSVDKQCEKKDQGPVAMELDESGSALVFATANGQTSATSLKRAVVSGDDASSEDKNECASKDIFSIHISMRTMYSICKERLQCARRICVVVAVTYLALFLLV